MDFNTYDSERTDEDLRVLSLIEEWNAVMPKVSLCWTNEAFKQIRNRALGVRNPYPHAKDTDYSTFLKIVLKEKIDQAEEELVRSLRALRAFREKYLDI